MAEFSGIKGIGSREQLMALGAPRENQDFMITPKTVRDTLLVNGATALESNNLLFSTAPKNPAYKTNEFPNNSQAFSILGINIKPDILFATTDATDEPSAINTYLSFLETSFFSLKIEGTDIINEPLSVLCPWFVVNSPSATDEAAAWNRTERRNGDQGYWLPEPIIIGAGTTFEIKLTVNGTYTTEAVGTTNYLTLPNSGLTNSKGYAIFFDLITKQIRERR
jgi:hypothetical protein